MAEEPWYGKYVDDKREGTTYFKGFDERCFIIHVGGDNLNTLRFEGLGFAAGRVAGYSSHFVCPIFEGMSYDRTSLGSGSTDDCEDG